MRSALVLLVALASVFASVAGARYRSRSDDSTSDESEEELSIENVSNPLSSSDEEDSSEEQGGGLNNPHGLDALREGVAGAQVFRVAINSPADRKRFNSVAKKIYLDMVHISNSDVDILVRPSFLDRTKQLLQLFNLEYKTLIEDVQRKIDVENPAMSEEEQELVGKQGHKLTFDHYHGVQEMHGYLDYLSQTYRDYVSTEVIGTTHGGRQLKLIKISSGYPNASAIWIDGGIHAREWIASAVALHIARELVEYRDNLPAAMKQVDYYILPMVNPDGYEYSRSVSSNRMWRKNRKPGRFCNGVDLNRNYAYKWGGKGTSSSECQDIYRGSSANSELETLAITNYLTQKIPKVQGFLTFHSYGQYILYPWGYAKKVPPDYQDLQRVGDLAAQRIQQATGAKYKVGNSASLLYPAAGASDDWAKANGKIKYTYTVELRDDGNSGFLLPASEINACGKDGFEVVKTVAEALAQSSPYIAQP